jgi:hypothetical protein
MNPARGAEQRPDDWCHLERYRVPPPPANFQPTNTEAASWAS